MVSEGEEGGEDADNDAVVLDPHLNKHLRHWGINMMQVGSGGGGMMECVG